MGKKQLFTRDEFMRAIATKKKFVIINQHKEFLLINTIIHASPCDFEIKYYEGMYPLSQDISLSKSNQRTYYQYDSFEKIMKDYYKVKLCKHCNPKPSK